MVAMNGQGESTRGKARILEYCNNFCHQSLGRRYDKRYE